jgi:NhaC family Na+:H+ antiporter
MIYYGFKIINASFFLPSCIVICALTSFATGSSWSTSATVGIALIGIGKVLGFDTGMVAGAVISGAYFGDKMSPLSDTTNLAAAVTETNLFDHIKYMMITTFPTIVITFIFFLLFNLINLPNDEISNQSYIELIPNFFNTTPILFLVPIFVIILIIKKNKPGYSTFFGDIISFVFCLNFSR